MSAATLIQSMPEQAHVPTTRRRVKVQLVHGVHHIKDMVKSLRPSNESQMGVTHMIQLKAGDILEVDANSREARDADPGTQDNPNPYYTGKFRQIYDEEIGQQPGESPIEAAARLRRMADQIERDMKASQDGPTPTMQDIEAAKAILQRAGISTQQGQPEVKAQQPIPTAPAPQKRKLLDFDKLPDKELIDFAASEEIEVSDTSKRSELLKAIKQWASTKR